MKLFKRFLLLALCAIPTFAQGQIATTAGSNLTAWNGNSGATNNNNWNQMMNSRTLASGGGAGATADFGNCNSLILRCAQPKCVGCNTLDLARPIVAGCVNSNATCKKYGDDLIEFISAQLVSNANNKAQQAEIAAQQMAAQAAAAQSNAQLQQMQAQMQQMQYEMQQQNAQQMAQMQAALDEQKALTAAAMEQATKQPEASAPVPSGNGALTDDMVAAAEKGIEADILARKQISGQILSKIENAEIALKKLKATMDTAFTYAKCDARGNNCAGPKRVKMFKEKAHAFFEPYDEIVDEAYEALEMALAVGVDVSDVIMMLSGGCNQWGKFLCTGEKEKHEVQYYNNNNCKNGRSVKYGTVKGGQECAINMAVPPQDDSRCTVTQLIGGAGDNDPVLREWLDENYEGDRLVRVGCATSALESIAIFGRRSSKKGATLDLDTLERIILQDAPDYVGGNRFTGGSVNDSIDRVKYCTLTQSGYNNLLAAVQSKKLPKRICVPHDNLRYVAEREAGVVSVDGASNGEVYLSKADAERANKVQSNVCTEDKNKTGYWSCTAPQGYKFYGARLLTDFEYFCETTGGYVISAKQCECNVGEEFYEGQGCTASALNSAPNIASVATDCEKAGGYYSFVQHSCMCGAVPMDYEKQKCDSGTIKSKK
ncbi:MAG: hypothetical protein IJW84_03185 [Alphaproteobacteria bacterium]|nr:hypothetical protein [Alphaproteobacteria bacterium]